MNGDDNVLIGKGETLQRLLLKRANRHGLIAGATGTGKTVTLQILAEGFSAHGVPVFMAFNSGDSLPIFGRNDACDSINQD